MAEDAIKKISGPAIVTQAEFQTTKKIEKKDKDGNVSIFYQLQEDDGKTLTNLSEKQFKTLADIYGFNPLETNEEKSKDIKIAEERFFNPTEADLAGFEDDMVHEKYSPEEERFFNPTEADLTAFEDDITREYPDEEPTHQPKSTPHPEPTRQGEPIRHPEPTPHPELVSGSQPTKTSKLNQADKDNPRDGLGNTAEDLHAAILDSIKRGTDGENPDIDPDPNL